MTVNNESCVSASCYISKPAALKFVVFIGAVSLCSDFTYEGARSITGPFLTDIIESFLAGSNADAS